MLPPLPNGGQLTLNAPGWGRGVGTGGAVWPAAGALCRLLRGQRLDGLSVLELGTGTGAVGLYAAGCGARSVVLTDADASLCSLAAAVAVKVQRFLRILAKRSERNGRNGNPRNSGSANRNPKVALYLPDHAAHARAAWPARGAAPRLLTARRFTHELAVHAPGRLCMSRSSGGRIALARLCVLMKA